MAGDLHDRAALRHAAEGQDVVYHVAGAIAARSEAEFLAANRDGTAQRARGGGAGRRAAPRVRLVHGRGRARRIRGRPLRGDEPPRPVTAYGRSKLAAEQVVTASPLPWSIVRPPMVYGPRDREVLKVFRLARFGHRPGLRRRHPGALRGPRRRSGGCADRGRHRARPPFGGPTTPATPKSSLAPSWPAPSARPWAGRRW